MKLYILSEDDVPFTELDNVLGEVIMCKDCKNYLTDDGIGIMCQMHYYRVKPGDYCSWAERKEDGAI